jgi:two-component system chemotaxis response regulator CheY
MDQDLRIKLQPVIDLAAAGALLDELRAKAVSGPVRLDASAVEVISLPGIQIILATIRSRRNVLVSEPSAAFIGAFMEHGIVWDAEAAACTAKPVTSTAEPYAEPSIEPVARGASPKRILTIDDSKTMRDMLMLTLANNGYEVLQAVDGQDGLDVLGRESVDVVITDINMPRLDGYGVIQHMRDRREYDAMPILVLTTESDQEKKERARQLGATGFIVKPFNPTGLVEVLRKVAA